MRSLPHRLRPAGSIRAAAVLTGLVPVLLAAACSSSHHGTVAAGSATASTASASLSTPAPSSPTATPARTLSHSPSKSAVTTTTGPSTVVPSISIPPNLCAATDKAQNTADAYMGALSAGNEKEALACVFGKSVPRTTTDALLAHQQGTAVYLPEQGGLNGPTEFDYTGGGKRIRVTVTRQGTGQTLVTGVTVRPS